MTITDNDSKWEGEHDVTLKLDYDRENVVAHGNITKPLAEVK